MIVLVFFIALIVLMMLGVPIAFSLGIASAGYMLATDTSLAMIAQRMVNGANSFTMLAIPFFFMAGELMNISGVTEKIINMARALVGHFKGGLAQVNIVASVFFAGVSGSATADTAALGSSLIPAMVKEGYDLDFSAAITVASSCVGPIIPPSITLVLYGVLSGTDVGRLLIAGIVPGLVIAGTQMIYTHFYSVKMDYPSYPKATPREMGKAVTSGFSALMMPIIIIGGTMTVHSHRICRHCGPVWHHHWLFRLPEYFCKTVLRLLKTGWRKQHEQHVYPRRRQLLLLGAYYVQGSGCPGRSYARDQYQQICAAGSDFSPADHHWLLHAGLSGPGSPDPHSHARGGGHRR